MKTFQLNHGVKQKEKEKKTSHRYRLRKMNAQIMNRKITCYLRQLRHNITFFIRCNLHKSPGRVAQSVGHLTRKSGVLGSIPGMATYFRFSFRFFKKGSCQLLAKVCARSTG